MAAGKQLKRILLTADAVGGVWQYTASLARGLMGDGVHVTVATMGPRPSASQRSELPESVDLVSSDFALEWTTDPWRDVDAAGDWLLLVARQCQPDLVHLNGYAHGALPWTTPAVLVAHSCVLSWWRAVHGCSAPAEWNEYRRRIQAGLLACDQVVAPSAFMARALSDNYAFDYDRVAIIHNGIPPVSRTRHAKEPFCLGAGRLWDEAKNLSLLTSVADKTNVPIYLAGDTADAAATGLHCLGRLSHPELQQWMERAQFFLHPAVYEPFGLAVLEAARARCCLLLADTPSSRELWGDAALLIDPRQPMLWAAEINRLSADQDRCESLAAAAQARSMQFSDEAFMAGYRKLYSQTLNRAREAA